MAKIKFSSCLSAFMKNQRSALCVFLPFSLLLFPLFRLSIGKNGLLHVN